MMILVRSRDDDYYFVWPII